MCMRWERCGAGAGPVGAGAGGGWSGAVVAFAAGAVLAVAVVLEGLTRWVAKVQFGVVTGLCVWDAGCWAGAASERG